MEYGPIRICYSPSFFNFYVGDSSGNDKDDRCAFGVPLLSTFQNPLTDEITRTCAVPGGVASFSELRDTRVRNRNCGARIESSMRGIVDPMGGSFYAFAISDTSGEDDQKLWYKEILLVRW